MYHRELSVNHSYTIECSCNLVPHQCIIARSPLLRLSQRTADGDDDSSDGKAGGGKDQDADGDDDSSDDGAELGAVADEPTTTQASSSATATAAAAEAEANAKAAASAERPPPSLYMQLVPRMSYMAQVESLAPADDEKLYVWDTPASALVGTTQVNRRCIWGSCPYDHCSAFARVGVAVPLALAELSGLPREAGLTSCLEGTQFENAAVRNIWLRLACHLLQAYSPPPPPPRGAPVVPHTGPH